MLIKYFFSWFGLMVIAVLNGGFRDAVYKTWFGDPAAHQISTAILLLMITIYLFFLTRVWPIKSARLAWSVGWMWFIMTEIFEFGMGRLILNKSWDELFYMYNIFHGQLWLLIPLWVLIGPYVFYRAKEK
ncbi:MAG: hypothetical protein JW995_07400 [Melioribacteraceae bacterium]|nr:hypothetical protein [Melioribacteraceae bacterium]